MNGDAALWLLQAVLPGMVERGFGRIVLTLTGHALYPSDEGSADLVAYAASKAVQFGLLNALAGPMARHDVLINAVSPVAATRMHSGEATPDLSPERVVPGVIYLASEECAVAGLILRASQGHFSIGSYAVSPGMRLHPEQFEPEVIAASWQRIVSGPLTSPRQISERRPVS